MSEIGLITYLIFKTVTIVQIQIQFYWTCSQKAKNQKAKQTIMHCTTKQYNTRQNEIKWKKNR